MTDIVLAKFEPVDEVYGYAPPFGILFLASALEKAGFSVAVFHEAGTRQAISVLVDAVAATRPLFVGFSAFTSSILIPTKKASIAVKERTNVPVIWGGIHSTILPEQTLSNSFVDVICVGEGEETVVELAQRFRGGASIGPNLDDLRGIGYRLNGTPHLTEPRPFLEDVDVCSPAWHLVDVEKYIYSGAHFYTQIGSRLGGERIGAMITSRGCPWRCAYCYNQAVHKRKFRAQSAAKVLAEAAFLKRRGASTIIFEDDNFFADRKRVLEIARNLDMKWSSTVRADYLAQWGDEFIRELSENGCVELRIGAESGSQRVLDLMQKDINAADIRTAVDLCARHDIKTLLNFMVGIPGETWPDVLQTLALTDELERDYSTVSIGSPAVYIPWPGTYLSEEARRQGFVAPTTLEGWSRYWAQRATVAPYQDRRIMFIGFYKSLLRRTFEGVPFPWLARALQRIARLRWKHRYFRFPLDYHLPAFVLRALRSVGLRSMARAIYQ